MALEAQDPDFAVISTATFSPVAPPVGGGFRQRVQAAAFRQQLLQSQESLQYMGYLKSDDEHNYWRVTLRVPSMQEVNYGAVLDRAREVVDSIIAESETVKPERVLVCGSIPLIYNVQQKLLDDLIKSFLLAFTLVSMALMLLFRSIACGLICMIPNLLPSAIVFGLMGWLGWPVEVGTVLTASAALGIAVDDSLHFITWFQRALSAGSSITQAVAAAYRRLWTGHGADHFGVRTGSGGVQCQRVCTHLALRLVYVHFAVPRPAGRHDRAASNLAESLGAAL